ncbi:Homocysteine S-methyltransferase [Harpegnathos saltator]|uniref:Homocysteine S-methyltransferase n=2 Tax=Harpegnathos saltator TaxID=610380 RepID=E2C781_HARSA|nr:Homocysteine S-methyltransferase [Harpegnathos saltator]
MDKVIVLDGALDKQLSRNMPHISETDEVLAMRALMYDQDAVYKAHLDFLRAGAQIIRTNTYRTTISLFPSAFGLPICICDQTRVITAVALAKKAVRKYFEEIGGDSNNIEDYNQRRPLIAGCCDGYNFLPFYDVGKITKELPISQLLSFHEERIDILVRSGVDILAFESISCLIEVIAISQALRKYPTIRVWITFLCKMNGDLLDDNLLITAIMLCKETLPGQLMAVGVECQYIASSLEPIRTLMRNINNFKDWVFPFLFYIDKNHLSTMTVPVDAAGPSRPVQPVAQWLDIGVRYVGGGFGTNAEDIKEICREVDYYRISRGEMFATLMTCSAQNKNLSKM